MTDGILGAWKSARKQRRLLAHERQQPLDSGETHGSAARQISAVGLIHMITMHRRALQSWLGTFA